MFVPNTLKTRYLGNVHAMKVNGDKSRPQMPPKKEKKVYTS